MSSSPRNSSRSEADPHKSPTDGGPPRRGESLESAQQPELLEEETQTFLPGMDSDLTGPVPVRQTQKSANPLERTGTQTMTRGLSMFQKVGKKVEAMNNVSNAITSPETKELQQKLADSVSRKKPLWCDCNDLQRLWNALRAEIEQVRKTCNVDTQTTSESLNAKIDTNRRLADERVEEAMESLSSAEEAQDAANQRVDELIERVEKLSKAFEDVHMESLGSLEKQVEKHTQEIQEQLQQFRDDLEQVQVSLTDLSGASYQARADIESAKETIVQFGEALRKEGKAQLEARFESIASDLKKSEASVLEQIKKVSAREAEEVSQVTERLRIAESAVEQLDMKMDNEILQSTQKASQAREKIRVECLNDIKQLQKDLHCVGSAVAQVANISTRSVEWVIQEASSRLLRAGDQEAANTGDCSIATSQKFEAGGGKGLWLELVRYAEPSIDGSDIKDCGLKLFAEKGLRLIFRLCIGDVWYTGDHTFDGQEPFSTNRLFMLNEHIQPDNTLRVCFEILEAAFSLEAHSSFAALGFSGLYEEEEEEVPASDTCIFTRYVNHRTLDLVQAQVDNMNSRMTRRVEWRLEQASRLPRCFSEGEPMCSTAFQAAGLEGLQLVFYPSGYEGAKSGYCSCFLYCPASSSLRCWLSVGNQRREAKLAFANEGFFGRTNFCRLDQCVDAATDEVRVILEIDEAQQDTTKPLIHQTSTSHMGSRPETSVMSTNEATVDSVLRIQKATGHLEGVKQLPSIWTSKIAGSITDALEGFHHIKDLRYKKRPNSRLLNNYDRSGAATSMSVYCDSNPPSRLGHRERSMSPAPDHRNRATSSLSMYSDVRVPLTARPPSSRNPVRSNLSSKYSAYMG